VNRYRYEDGINNLSSVHDVAVKILVTLQQIEQLFDKTCLGRTVTEHPKDL
jgi:hypothetical protein